ncbi:hypothetical protein [Mycobacterium terramassiliense]|uniref:Secreted protein n=1 Tax=Mycobacterium terramassiliense TaxID=1841859 RepID=A0A2U3NK07_9MYCO|nr:hypothetical protein [Mycobacterium terramassiliense]SPM31830.1 hypothetical protein MTAB308_5355 [Mycobacterium terramassiliense]
MSRPVTILKATAAITPLLALTALALASPASANTYTKFLAVDCPQPYSQTCTPRQGIQVGGSGTPYFITFTGDPHACAPGEVHIFVDGAEEGHSQVQPGQPAHFFRVPHGPGNNHTVDVQMDGVLGGCNKGAMSGWSGTLEVQTDVDKGI